MTVIIDRELEWLTRLAKNGTWPANPFLRDVVSITLMRKGLIEVVQPRAPYLPYATITPAGRAALADSK